VSLHLHLRDRVVRVVGDNRGNSRVILALEECGSTASGALSSASDFSFREPVSEQREGSSSIVREGGFADRFSGPQDAEEEMRGTWGIRRTFCDGLAELAPLVAAGAKVEPV